MPDTIFHGITTNLLQAGTSDIQIPSTAIIGLVATAPDATVGAFPLDTPVLVTDVRAALAHAGTTGTLALALAAIADQCSPMVVVVRVATPATSMISPEPTQDSLVIGTYAAGQYTGMKALLTAAAKVGFRPRILGTPGLTSAATTAALIPIAQQLRGMAYCLAVGSDVADVVTYAATYGARELELLWPESSEGAGHTEARALGLRARIDQTIGWHKSLSNVLINNMAGLAHDVSWALDGSSSDAAALNDANVTTIINRNGFRFWGNRTTSSVPAYSFEVATRTSQALADALEDAFFQYSDAPLTAGLVKDILASANAAFRKLVAQGRLIGAKAWFDPALNPSQSLANGQAQIDYDFTPVAPLEGLTENQRITDTYYTDFASQLQSVTATA
jgi:phage tail sheath protein FI